MNDGILERVWLPSNADPPAFHYFHAMMSKAVAPFHMYHSDYFSKDYFLIW